MTQPILTVPTPTNSTLQYVKTIAVPMASELYLDLLKVGWFTGFIFEPKGWGIEGKWAMMRKAGA